MPMEEPIEASQVVDEGARQAEEDALCEVLAAADSLLRAKSQLHASLKEGWFCLARARYQMGAVSVSQLQYDQNMRACVTLQACVSGDSGPATWALHRVQEDEEVPTTLRRRRVPDSADTAASRASTLGQLPAAPLRWFAGAMPPMALKAAQQHFWRALEAVVDATNAQARLRDLPVPGAPAPADDCSDAASEPVGGEPECSEEVSRLLDKLAVSQADASAVEDWNRGEDTRLEGDEGSRETTVMV